MAQDILFTPYGGMNVKADATYTGDNVPAEADVVILTRGVKITDETDSKTPLRGVRMIVETTGLTPPTSPIDNVPIVWIEGVSFVFIAASTYTFLDDGIIAYGKRITA